MRIIPAVDLKGGEAVRLEGGDPSRATVYYPDPLEAARRWEEEGAELLHLVDLDRALGLGDNRPVLARLAQGLRIPFQVGGGIRTLEALREVLDLGAMRGVVGTVAVENPPLLREMLALAGPERLAVALDARGLRPVVRGWREEAGPPIPALLEAWAALGVRTVIYTDVERDGTLRGLALEAIARVRELWPHELIAGGGVAGLEDLRALKALGVDGALVGKALYEGRVRLKEAV